MHTGANNAHEPDKELHFQDVDEFREFLELVGDGFDARNWRVISGKNEFIRTRIYSLVSPDTDFYARLRFPEDDVHQIEIRRDADILTWGSCAAEATVELMFHQYRERRGTYLERRIFEDAVQAFRESYR